MKLVNAQMLGRENGGGMEGHLLPIPMCLSVGALYYSNLRSMGTY